MSRRNPPTEREYKRYRDAGTGEFVTKAEADARPNETVAETVWVAAPTYAEVEAAAEAIFQLRYPGHRYLGDEWARAYARAALDAAAGVRA